MILKRRLRVEGMKDTHFFVEIYTNLHVVGMYSSTLYIDGPP